MAFVRRARVKEWELVVLGSWDTAAPGQQALDAALRRSLFAEVASLLGQTHCAILWDYDFFDTVDPSLLFDEAVKLIFPLPDLCMVLQLHLSERRIPLRSIWN